MGSIETKPVLCSEYNSAYKIETDINMYIDKGLRVVNQSFITYMWVYVVLPWQISIWIQDYIFTISEIATCGINSNIETKYDNNWKQKVFDPSISLMYDQVLGHVDMWWHPGITVPVLVIPGLNLIGSLAYMIVGAIYQSDWGAILSKQFDIIQLK